MTQSTTLATTKTTGSASSTNNVPNALLTPLLAIINHVIRQEPWAQKQLQGFAGKQVRLELPMLPFSGAVLAVQEKGEFVAPTQEQLQAIPNVTLTLGTQAISAWVSGGQEAVISHIRLSGDAEFANTLSTLAKNLRWDIEEDLSKWMGDIVAHRFVNDVRLFGKQVQNSALALRDNLLEYYLDEQPALVRKSELPQFQQGVADTRDHLARLEKRLAKLSS